MENTHKYAVLTNRLLLGLLFLIPGIMKAFVMKPSGVAGFLSSLGFPAALFFAWVLFLSEIIFGLAVLLNFKLKWSVIPLMVIILVAAFTANFALDKAPSFIMHLLVAADLWMIGSKGKR